MVRVPRLFPASTIVCFASGPSLTREDVDLCRGKAPVIAVNDTYRWAPWADVLYAADAEWWQAHQGVPDFQGRKYSVNNPDPKRAITHPADVGVLAHAGFEGLSTAPTGLCCGLRGGSNSGYQAINLAVHLGASRVLLLGYDMQKPDGGAAHFVGHAAARPAITSPYGLMRRAFDGLVEPLRVAGVRIVNCSRATALTCFPRQSLAVALAGVSVAA